MAKNDYFVIVYKILRHLYECLKEDREINWDELQPNSRAFPIGEKYWEYIWLNMTREGLITGASDIPRMNDDPGVKITRFLKITPKGIEYLEENSMMKKAENGIRTDSELISKAI